MSRLTSTTHRNTYASSSTPQPPTQILQPNAHASSSTTGRSSPYTSNTQLHQPQPRPWSSSSSTAQGASGRGTPSAYSESPYGNDQEGSYKGGTQAGGGYSRSAYEVERQNDDKLEGLLGRVKLLKDITVGIGDEVRQSNMELGSMTDAFTSTSSLLGGTFKRMNTMAKRQGGNWCYFMLFLVFVLWIFVVVWFKRK